VTPNEILHLILEDLRTFKKCAVVFDLDSTLFCVSPRSEAILHDLALEPSFRARFPEAALVLEKISVLPEEYGVKSALMRSGLAVSMDLMITVRDYWREKFFANSHLHHDLIYPGADRFVHRVFDAGAEVYYLTGRNDQKMRTGTMANLANWKFPDIPIERVMMKGSLDVSDEKFKEVRLKELASRHDRIWLFENEPVIIHQVRRALPDVRIVYMDSAHSGKANPPTDLLTLRMDFRLTE
jgi:hypothetical protein